MNFPFVIVVVVVKIKMRVEDFAVITVQNCYAEMLKHLVNFFFSF
jgi:hypothetical protein